MDALALSLFQQALRDIRQEAERSEKDLGSPPAVMFVSQHAPSDHQYFNTGPVIRRWQVEESVASEIPVDQEPPDQAKVGMYYDTGRGDFSMLSDPSRVRIGWQVGPRYGRGYDFAIVNGKLSGEARALWVS